MSDEVLWRRDVLGASDAPAVVGCDPFRTAGDLWAEKTGRVPSGGEADRSPVNPRALGSALEPLLLSAARLELGVPLAPQVWYRHPDAPLGCSVDGLALEADPPTLVEAKTCGILNRPSQLLAAYGEEWTDEVPDSVVVQVHHELVVLAAQPNLPPIRDVLVVALLGDGRGLRRYRLRFDAALAEEIIGAELEFWHDYVETNRPPPYDPPSLATLRAWRRRPELPAVQVDHWLMFDWIKAREAAKDAAKAEDEARRQLLVALGDAESGVCSVGRVTYLPVARKGYTVQPTTARTLRYYEPKGAAA
jgi:predicted phage-related endonuclease